MKAISIKNGWGGFSDGKLDEYAPNHFAIYRTKREALLHYEDVRRVEITWERGE